MQTPKAQQLLKAVLVVRAVAKQPSNAAIVKASLPKPTIDTGARPRADKKLMRPKNAADAEHDLNAVMIEAAAAAEKKKETTTPVEALMLKSPRL